MGPQRVKNIAEPVMVYRVSREQGSPRRRASRPLRLPVLAVALVVVAACLAAVFIWKPWHTPRPGGLPVLAVLPFANLTGDTSLDYLSLAVPDGVLTMLSSSPVLRVVARSASLTSLPDDPPQQIAWRLGADFLLEGSIRQGALGYQVAARLLDGTTGEQVWAATFGGQGLDVAALQEAVARDVYVGLGSARGTLAGQLVPLAWERLSDDPAEYDIFLRGGAALLTFTDTGRSDAFRILSEGVAKYPDSTLLRTLLAGIHYNRVADRVSEDVRRDVDAAWSLLQAVSTRRDMTTLEQWLFHYVRALVGPLATGNHAAALADAIEAQGLVPFEPQASIDLSRIASDAGRPDLGIAWAEFSLQADDRFADWKKDWIAWGHLMSGDTKTALVYYDALEFPCRDCKIVALVRAGRLAEAQDMVKDWQAEYPDLRLEHFRTEWTGRFPSMVEPQLSAYLDDLRKAGLPEGAAPP